MTTALARRDEQIDALVLDDVRTLLPVGKSTDKEISVFIKFCQAARLNPWLHEAYLIKYDERAPASIVVGNNFYTKAAAESPGYLGHRAGITVQNRDEVKSGAPIDRKGTMEVPGDTLIGAWCVVERKGKIPFEWSVSLKEYQGRKGTGELTKFWKEKGATMVVKVVETQALRKCGYGMANEYISEDDSGISIVSQEEATEEQQEAIDVNYKEETVFPDANAIIAAKTDVDLPESMTCPIHQVEWFKKGKMPKYAHTVEGEKGPRGGAVWCNMDEVQAQQSDEPAKDAAQDAPTSTLGGKAEESPTEDGEAPRMAIENLGDLKTYAASISIVNEGEMLKALGVDDKSQIGDLGEAAGMLAQYANADSAFGPSQ